MSTFARFHALALLLIAWLTVLPSLAHAAAKTDIVYLKNGDRITGEVKSLLRGKLEFKTDHMDTVLIEWDQIEQIVSDTSQSIELANETRFFGPLEKSAT